MKYCTYNYRNHERSQYCYDINTITHALPITHNYRKLPRIACICQENMTIIESPLCPLMVLTVTPSEYRA